VASAIAVFGALLKAGAMEAQSSDLECIQRYNAVVAGNPSFATINAGNPANGCRRVAFAVTSDWGARELFGTVAQPRDMAATRDQTTAAPGEASAPIEPVEAAGGSVSAVGTGKGAGAVAAIAINPALFFVNPNDTEAVARWSRFSDVTLLVPASDFEDGDADGGGEDDSGEGVDYVGIRWGLNMTGLQRGSQLHRAVVSAYDAFLATGTTQTQQIQSLLARLSPDNLEPCIRALVETNSLNQDATGKITQTCGGAPIAADPAVITALQGAIRAARIQADSKYFGLDLRADFGDLSLAGVDTVSGTALFAGLGWGRRFSRGEDATAGVRAHLGARYWDADGEDDSNVAVEGGLAFEAIRFYNYQRLTMVGGLDFQHRTDGALPDDEETSINLRGTLNVPVTPTTSVTINLAAPLKGERRGPVLSIKANWRLLWSRSF
jgi:hypothetical protein